MKIRRTNQWGNIRHGLTDAHDITVLIVQLAVVQVYLPTGHDRREPYPGYFGRQGTGIGRQRMERRKTIRDNEDDQQRPVSSVSCNNGVQQMR